LTQISQLRAAREASGLTVEQVAKKTNIRIGVIQDLEKNSVEVCGGIAYARGHIRSIAKVIKADGDLLVAEIEAAQGSDSRKIIDQFYANNIADRPKVKKVMKFSTLAALAGGILGIGFVVAIALNNVTSTNGMSDVAPSVSPTASSTTPATSNIAGVNLVLTGVSGKSWIGITNDQGETIFDNQIKSGESQSFSDSTSLKITIGNAAAVNVSLNGVDLGVAGKYGEVVRYKYTQAGATKE
jgi:cytoskeleton protein RodZ